MAAAADVGRFAAAAGPSSEVCGAALRDHGCTVGAESDSNDDDDGDEYDAARAQLDEEEEDDDDDELLDDDRFDDGHDDGDSDDGGGGRRRRARRGCAPNGCGSVSSGRRGRRAATAVRRGG